MWSDGRDVAAHGRERGKEPLVLSYPPLEALFEPRIYVYGEKITSVTNRFSNVSVVSVMAPMKYLCYDAYLVWRLEQSSTYTAALGSWG